MRRCSIAAWSRCARATTILRSTGTDSITTYGRASNLLSRVEKGTSLLYILKKTNLSNHRRPFMDEFLKLAAAKFEVVVFTASQRVYADQVLNRIDPTGEYIHHRMFREHCRNQDGNFIKDLRVLGRDLRRTLIIEVQHKRASASRSRCRAHCGKYR